MRVLLRFCDVILAKPFFGKHIGKHVIGADFRKRDRRRNGRIVFGETDEFRLFPARTSERIECRIAKRARDLTSTIRTEIEEDERILRARCFTRQAGRNDEFVGHLCCIRIFHDLSRIALGRILPQPNSAPSLFDTIPTIIAIHRIIATRDHADAHISIRHILENGCDLLLELFDVTTSAARRHITTVHEAVDAHLIHTKTLGHLEQGIKMGVIRMHATIRKEPHKMQGRTMLSDRSHRRGDHLVFEELAALAGIIDTRELLVDRSSSTDIQMPDLGIAHLTLRQTNGLSRSIEFDVWTGREKLIEMRRVCQ